MITGTGVTPMRCEDEELLHVGHEEEQGRVSAGRGRVWRGPTLKRLLTSTSRDSDIPDRASDTFVSALLPDTVIYWNQSNVF